MTSVMKTNQCFEEVNACNPGLLQRRRSSSSSKDPDTKITQLNKDIKIQIAFGVMCCLPSHALLVLCPSGLLSHGGSACQLTICMCVCVWLSIPATPPPIKSYDCVICPQTHGQLDTHQPSQERKDHQTVAELTWRCGHAAGIKQRCFWPFYVSLKRISASEPHTNMLKGFKIRLSLTDEGK